MSARKQHGKAARKRRLPRPLLDKQLSILAQRIHDHRVSLEAVQSETRPRPDHSVVEWYAHKAFGMMLNHELGILRSIEALANTLAEELQ